MRQREKRGRQGREEGEEEGGEEEAYKEGKNSTGSHTRHLTHEATPPQNTLCYQVPLYKPLRKRDSWNSLGAQC